jgi:hypothetical protein
MFSEQNKNMEENGMLDLVTIVAAAVVCALPIMFMGYVKLMVRRVEKHTVRYNNCAEL